MMEAENTAAAEERKRLRVNIDILFEIDNGDRESAQLNRLTRRL
jgi:hypothetical protein